MKKVTIYITLFLISIVSFKDVAQEKLKLNTLTTNTTFKQEKKSKNTHTDSGQNINLSEKENINDLNLKFIKIDATDYYNYKKKYSNGVEIDSTIVNKPDNSFKLIVKNKERVFSCGVNYNNCTYYKGYLKALNRYILTFCGEGYCGTYLLDRKTGIKNYLQSPFDSECETPSLSKDQNTLISFASSVFNKSSFIALYKKNIKTQEMNFNEFSSFKTSNWRIDEIIWIDNNSIALKVYDKYGGIRGDKLINIRYLKGIIE